VCAPHAYSSVKNRLDRVNELLKRELSDLIRREITFKASLVTVREVDVTADLKQAHVYMGVVGTPAERKEAMSELYDHRSRFQRELGKRVVMKFTPHLHFKLDDVGERGDRVLNLLAELNLPDEPPAEAEEEKS
jgi:ribosome-binding factor A